MPQSQIKQGAIAWGWARLGWTLLSLLLLTAAVLVWIASYFDWSEPADLTRTQAADLPYLSSVGAPVHGKILAIVTSTASMQVPKDDGIKTKPAGFELTELARAYAVFTANGFEVDIASPQGGAAPYVRDDEDMGAFDYAFFNDKSAMAKVNATLPLNAVDVSAYRAVYLVGGKGTMFDFRHNAQLQQLLQQSWQQGAVLAAVCHGPAGLLGVKDGDGKPLLAGRTVTAFSNAEELFLIPAAPAVFGTLLEDDLRAAGAKVSTGPLYLDQVVVDGRLISGQNPWSVWRMAEATVRALGVAPRARQHNGDEIAVQLLGIYHQQGADAAAQWLAQLPPDQLQRLDRRLYSIHMLIALMQQQWKQAIDLFGILRQIDGLHQALPANAADVV